MDCYSAESEFIESLDFLSPPVKRIHNNREGFGSVYNTDTNDVHLLRGLRNKFVRHFSPPLITSTTDKPSNTESSTSLILKKTSERQILQQYSFVSYTSLLRPENNTSSLSKPELLPNKKDKPLIKVTVIPKSDHIQTAKLLRKRRYIPKRVKSTTSNHENSIQTKNVYLIVAGRRKEKIYEIKTTGSAKLSTDHDSYSKDEEDHPFKDLCNFKHLIRSLNMDKKKNKEKEEPVDKPNAPQQTSLEWQGYPNCQECMCADDSKKSRVRIFGQFGISEGDKYVLRYGATVNDKPVLSDVAQLTRDFSPVIATTSYGTTDRQSVLQKDSCIQADYNYDLDSEKLPEPDYSDVVPSKESQGTQVNFNIQVAMMKGKSTSFSDKKIQCSCYNVAQKPENNTLKACQSPLVIISVYPKPSPENLIEAAVSTNENTRTPSPPRMDIYRSSQRIKSDRSSAKNNIDTRRSYKSATRSRSRSPSPKKHASRSKILEDTVVKAKVSEKRSPDRQKALRAIKEKIEEKDKLLKQEANTRKLPSKSNAINATQVSNHLNNLTVSNATQVSNKKNIRIYTASNATQISRKNQKLHTASNGTQMSARRQRCPVTDGTQYSNDAESFTTSNAMQCDDTVDSLQDIAPVKHSKNVVTSRYPQRPQTTQVSNTTQVPKKSHYITSNGTQVSRSVPYKVSTAGTQVSRNHQEFIASRFAKNQETFTAKPTQIFKNEQTSNLIARVSAEIGTNTDHARAKKVLVETYTKKLTEQMNQKDSGPARFDSSKVTININGDKEYYDVLFNQDKIATDLTIRKTLKDMGSQNENEGNPSLENLLHLSTSPIEKTVFKPENKSPTTLSPPLKNNLSDDDVAKHVSRLTIRDSIEISHRREDKSNNNNIKNTQTCFTAQVSGKGPDESEFLAPVKHYTGDDCSICDPIARDKQIRVLLGVDKVKSPFGKTQQANYCENGEGLPYHSIYRQECYKNQVTEVNFEIQKLCPCFKSVQPTNKASVSVQCRVADCAKTRFPKGNVEVVDTMGSTLEKFTPKFLKRDKIRNKSLFSKTDSQQLDAEKSLYQQLILNRNVQVFLQLDQFSKQKPIVLSRKQYDKVKKTIQKTISMKKSSHEKRKSLLPEKHVDSEVSVGEIRTKQPNDPKLYDEASQRSSRSRDEKEAQTDIYACSTNINGNIKAAWGKSRKQNSHGKSCSSDQSIDDSAVKPKKTKRDKDKKKRKGSRNEEVTLIDQCIGNSDGEELIKKRQKEHKKGRIAERLAKTLSKHHPDSPKDQACQGVNQKKQDRCPELALKDDHHYKMNNSAKNEKRKPNTSDQIEEVERKETELKTYVLFNAENTKDNDFREDKESDYECRHRKTMSSVEIRYASVSYMKQVAYSSTDVGALSDSSIAHVHSFHTLFRGHRKSATPNLGTSAYSLYTEEYNSENKSAKYIMEPRDSKPKKPFLRRLMSCLVMRSTRESEMKVPPGPEPEPPSVNSSIDSYHISTSLGAVEVSSSIYDTSASFYSNHTILPINSKIKRGFFSSVRGFLTNRKS